MYSINGENGSSNSQGGGGALFTRPDNLRSDARLAARMISLGVIELEEAKELLRMGFTLAKNAATNGREREFAACMKIALEVAKLEQAERHKMIDKTLPNRHSHTIEQGPPVTLEQLHSDPNYVQFLEQQSGADSNAGKLCNGHQQRNGQRMEDGKAPGDTESESG